ncbi:hypothetical protein [Maribellus sp. YY47]|uniref:hypothetical protein n=1 Tax=Maribellus sp. YY47 TaxID=2929486 RepID=UPI0020012F25|nr:hypothetical protein [Maribellus sp. YY47]MCK3685374.1 hypothetical protein [Maribellus sp. YY47]
MKILAVLFVIFNFLTPGKPTPKAEVYLEKGAETIAYQSTGETGKAIFHYLDAGSYRLLLTFPQQEGKFIKDKPRNRTLTKATYNAKNKTYYYQSAEGYFAVRFYGLSKIRSENFQASFSEEKEEEVKYIVIAKFGAHQRNASIGVSIRAITAARFKKAAEKAQSNLSSLSTPNIR